MPCRSDRRPRRAGGTILCLLAVLATVWPATAAALPSGATSAVVTGLGRVQDNQLGGHARARLAEPLDLDGDGAQDGDFRGEAEARWSVTNGVLEIGGLVSIYGREISQDRTRFHARAQAIFLDRVAVRSASVAVAAPLDVTLLFHVGGFGSDPWFENTGQNVPFNWVPPSGGVSAVAYADGIDGAFLSSGLRREDFVFEVPMQVLNDVPFDLSLNLYLDVAGQPDLARERGFARYSTSGAFDFLHTLVYAGLAGVAEDGTPLGALTLRSVGGPDYVPTPVLDPDDPTPALPEPASLALLGAGLGGLALRRRR